MVIVFSVIFFCVFECVIFIFFFEDDDIVKFGDLVKILLVLLIFFKFLLNVNIFIINLLGMFLIVL